EGRRIAGSWGHCRGLPTHSENGQSPAPVGTRSPTDAPRPQSHTAGGEMSDQPSEPVARPALAARYRATRARTERLCAPLEPDDYQLQSMPDCSPPKWHLAHTAWFFETFVLAPH